MRNQRPWMMSVDRLQMLQGLGMPGIAAKIAARVNKTPQDCGAITFRAADSNGVAELMIYDEIGFDWWTGEGMTAARFSEELAAIGKADTINVRINSPGGDVFDGLAIYNQLRRHSAKIVVDVDGVAASIASVIAMAGQEVRMGQSAMMMIHNAMGGVMGNAQDMLEFAEVLQKIDGELAETYADKSGRDVAEFRDLMDKETWLSADEAIELGMADSGDTDDAPPMTADLASRIRARSRRTVDLGV